MRYLQRVADAVTHEPLHIEPGLWLNVPATTVPALPPTVVRQGTIPHGNSLLALGTPLTVPSGPQIDAVNFKGPRAGTTSYPGTRLVPLPVGLAFPSFSAGRALAGTDPPNRALLRDGLAPVLGAIHVETSMKFGGTSGA